MPEPASPSAELARAEELVDDMAIAVRDVTTRIAAQVVRAVALAREEAEDIWAEAQSVRRTDSG